jgi:DNA replication protein DnaC
VEEKAMQNRFQVIRGNGSARTVSQRAQADDPMTRAFPKPEEIASMMPQTPAPKELFWTCKICGPVEPLGLPTGRWIRRSCACERALRQAKREREEFEAWKAQVAARTFEGWLGAAWEDEEIVAELCSMTFENYDASSFQKAYDEAFAFAQNPTGKNMIFSGSFGTGKTHLAAAIINALRERRVTARFASAPQLIRAIEDARKSYDQTRHIALLQQLAETPLLVLDDIDKIRSTEDRQDFFFLILDQRNKAKRPTIVTTNKYDDLEKYIGGAALSRLSRKAVTVDMTGDDHREEQ